MKNFITLLGSALATIGIALMSVSCGEKADDTNKEENGTKAEKPAEPAEPAEPAKPVEPKAASGGDSAELEGKMVGFWAPNAEAMTAQAKKEIGDDPNAQAILPMILAAIGNMAIEVTAGEVTIHGMGQADTATYKVTKADAAAKMLTMEVTDKDGTSEGTAIIEGDKLTLEKDGDELVLDRITKAAFDKRLEAAKNSPIPGLPPGIDQPVPVPPVPTPPAPTPPGQ